MITKELFIIVVLILVAIIVFLLLRSDFQYWNRKDEEKAKNGRFVRKLRSIRLCMAAHPDNEKDSEFADRIDDLEEMIQELEK